MRSRGGSSVSFFPVGRGSHVHELQRKNGTGMDGKRDYDRTARVIAEAKPDVAALQELDSKTKRSGGKDTLQELAVRTKLTGTYAKAIDYSGGSYGVGLLSREKPLSVKRIPLPGREEARVLLMAEFKDYCFCVTHLSLTREDSNASIDMIAALAAECRKPFFIAGDFNLTPGSEPIARMKKHFIPLSDFSQKRSLPINRRNALITSGCTGGERRRRSRWRNAE